MTVQDETRAYELRTLDEFERACDQALALAAPTTDPAQTPAAPIGPLGWLSLIGLVAVLILIGSALLPGVA